MKIVLTSPNNWCLDNNLTKDKVYEVVNEIKLSEGINVIYPEMVIKNDIGRDVAIPEHCFDTLKNCRKRKLRKLYE